MLDFKFIRENKDIVQAGAKKKHTDIDIEKLVTLDDERLKELKEVEDLRAEVNRVSNDISRNQDSALKIQLIEEMRIVKEDIKVKEGKLKEIITEWQVLMLQVPNVPDMSVPDGSGEDENKTKPEMGDFEAGGKTPGFWGYFLKNDGALLSWAIWNYAQEFFLKKNFSPFIPPVILNKEHFFGTGLYQVEQKISFKPKMVNIWPVRPKYQ